MSQHAGADGAPPVFADAADARRAIRAGRFRGHTSGLVPAHAQGNLMILPRAMAEDFHRFCQQNPKPCPILGAVSYTHLTLPTNREV